jgi:hypothetical protein
MPLFVTDIRPASAATRATAARTGAGGSISAARAYRRRLAALRQRAPDTLRARVRRALRMASASTRTE